MLRGNIGKMGKKRWTRESERERERGNKCVGLFA